MAYRVTKDVYVVDAEYLVAASTTINAGEIVCLNAGYAVPGSSTTGLVAKGIAKTTVDNSAGANGAKKVVVQTSYTPTGRRAFKVVNSGTGSATQANVGSTCYVFDANSITMTSTGRSEAGEIFRFESDGVWVFFK
ncbi:hypothetical protein BE21_57545 [Sorangium cellulosum]|uniref:Bacteriophage protein n=1 Tax=Sorangium cellulosum TaxID=56 RepID=A0A150U3J7_SORCE|nr:hypothetical protein BE21_57545 [Sorangium cellulosum]